MNKYGSGMWYVVIVVAEHSLSTRDEHREFSRGGVVYLLLS
jgi:hypothetical protein